MKIIIILAFLTFNHLGYSQLIDPFGKIITHEIKLNKLKNGSYLGAIEWTTGGKDSLQRYIVKGLDINAPVMVRIISKAPDHNIDLSFHKTGWDKSESKISTDGDKFVDKIFRTMNSAGLGVYSEVAGIPYLIIVKVGLQFPSTNSLIRITDDKEEYAQHLRKMGYTGDLFSENNASSSNNSSATSNNLKNNNLMYIVIILLAVIAILLIVFLMKRKTSKTVTLLVLCFGLSHVAISQNSAPQNIPVENQGKVFIGYSTQNVRNQVPVTYQLPGPRDIYLDVPINPEDGTFRTTAHISIEHEPGSMELSRDDAKEINERMREANEQFDRDYTDNMPGEESEGNQRFPPKDFDREEMDRLKAQVRELRRQVELLSQEDREYESNDQRNPEIVIYCKDKIQCQKCLDRGLNKVNSRVAKFEYLQNFYASEIKEINRNIAYGNAYSNVHGVSAIVWQRVLAKVIMPSVTTLRKAYNDKFNQYLESLEEELKYIEKCNNRFNPNGSTNVSLENQISISVNHYRSMRILD